MDLHERLRGELQATAVSDAAWQEFLLKLTDLMGARECVFGGGQGGHTNELFAPHSDPDYVTRYLDVYHQQNDIMRAVADQDALGALVDATLAAHPDVAAGARANPKAVNFLMGQVMRASGGQARPDAVRALLRTRLSLEEP